METPKCQIHGEMYLRPNARQTKEQFYCGEWYDCPLCTNSALFPSDELKKQIKFQGGINEK